MWLNEPELSDPFGRRHLNSHLVTRCRPAFANAPLDSIRGRMSAVETVVHPRTLVPVFDVPGGRAFGALPTTVLGYETWLPAIAEQAGWIRVMLPAKPDGVTGWLDASTVTRAPTSWEIRVYQRAGRVHLTEGTRIAHIWPISKHTASDAAPSGRTFLLAARRNPGDASHLTVLSVAAHTLTRWSGAGCDTVAIHAGPAHDGCIGVPANAVAALAQVPAGSQIRIYP